MPPSPLPLDAAPAGLPPATAACAPSDAFQRLLATDQAMERRLIAREALALAVSLATVLALRWLAQML
ncbi:MAG: hypothetical protein QM772_15960 [Ottowia sp.]|uniref:hypothetical protein n=1 Tax=Ottowia sp. TaxID=1898956 RepID=UPI0039E6045B